jgi:hypothetical protein
MKKNSYVFAADILQQFFPLIFKVNSSSFDQSRKKENVYYGVRVTVDNENKT